jgi:glycosyltransferase involved in cell wall biosynthesis
MSQRLRILHVLGELKPSGAETMLVAAAPLFQKAGLELEVLSTGVIPGPFAARFEATGYRLHHIPFSRSPGFFLKVRQLMQTGDYDVIHLHVEAANFWYGLIARSVDGAVVVRTVHNAFAFTGNLQWRRGLQRRLLNRFGVRHVAISASVRDTEQRHYQLPTTLVWNWYDSLRFVETTSKAKSAARAHFGIGEKDFVIASIGNCSPIKNHTAVIEALAMLPAEARPLYLHAGIEQHDAPERALAERLGVSDRIRFLGGTSDVLAVLEASDAYVMPSLFEGFGIAAIEALGTGLPALFSDVAGLRDFRGDFPNLVYCGVEARDVAMGIQALMQMPNEMRSSIRSTYPDIAKRRFGMERGVNEYLALYRGMLTKAGATQEPSVRENSHD